MDEENIVLSASAESYSTALATAFPILSATYNDIDVEIKEGTYNVGDVGEEEEENSDDIIDGKILTDQNYETPKDVDKFIDTSKGELVDKANLTDFDMIKAIAKQNNLEIRNPRKGCKHCYGRGFVGRDSKTKQPIPCSCIYLPKTPNQLAEEKMKDEKNGTTPEKKRHMYKQLRKLIKSEKKKLREQKLEERFDEKNVEQEV
jgi:hypothetical protein